MKKIVSLTESDLTRIVKRVIKENEEKDAIEKIAKFVFSKLPKDDIEFIGNLYKELGYDKFEDTIIVKAVPNRLLIFDGGVWHRQQQFTEKDLNIKEDRLTLICFFHNVTQPDSLKNRLVYPITEMKRV